MSGTDRWWEQPPATGDAFQAGHRAGAAWLQGLHPKKREEMARRLADRVRWNPAQFLDDYGGQLGPAYAVYRALFGTPTICEGEYSFGGPYVPEGRPREGETRSWRPTCTGAAAATPVRLPREGAVLTRADRVSDQ